MDAVIVAGGIPQPHEPLYQYSNGQAKALIDIAGKPMVQWVLDALGDAKTIDRVVVVGLTDKMGLKCGKPVDFLSNEGRLLENLKAGTARICELNPRAEYVLFVSSDIPAITGPMVDWVVETCGETKDDLYYNVVRREAMEERFPTSKRTYTRLKDLELCGGDLNVARTRIVNENSEFWGKILDARKNPAAQASLIGLDIIFKFLFRSLTIDDVIQRVADKLGLKGRAILCPYPEIAMDVDKPHQLEIMRAFMGAKLRRKPAVRKAAGQRGKGASSRSTAGKKTAGRAPRRTAAKPARKPAARPGRGGRKR
jgi:GTP:adenosylcobinamide-phosphate guanylyltransferase